MSLQKQILLAGYKTLFTEVHRAEEALSVGSVVDRFLDPYHKYSKLSQDPSGDYLAKANLSPAKNILRKGYSSRNAEEFLQTSLRTYWTGAMFKTTVPHSTMSQEMSSVVTGMNTTVLKGIFSTLHDDTDKAAEDISDKLHQFTQSVQVLITGLANTGSPPPVITVPGQIV